MSNEMIYGLTDFASPQFIQGFSILSQTTTVTTYTVGSARARTSDFIMEFPGNLPGLPASLSVDLSVRGAGGCYPLTAAQAAPGSNFNFFPVYLVANSAGTTGGSLNASAAVPALVIGTSDTGFVPPGYDSYQLIDWVIINSSVNFVQRHVSGSYNTREVMMGSRITLVTSGNATAATALPLNGVFTQITNFPKLTKVKVLASYTPATAGNDLDLYPGLGSYYAAVPYNMTGPVISVQVIDAFDMPIFDVNGVPTISYNVTASGDAVNLYITGYTYEVPFPG